MREVFHSIWTGLTTATALDQANLGLGIVGVVLMIRRTLWAFPVGLVAVTVQGVLFFRAKFYADAALQIFFFAALAGGWWHWAHGRGASETELPVTALSGRGRMVTLGLGVGATVLWAWALRTWTDAVMPWRDAFIAAFSVAEAALVVLFLTLNMRAARAVEYVRLTDSAVEVTRSAPSGARSSVVLPSAWLRVDLEEHDGRVPRLMLRTPARHEEIARAVGEDAKRDLALALGTALHDARHPQFDNPQLRG